MLRDTQQYKWHELQDLNYRVGQLNTTGSLEGRNVQLALSLAKLFFHQEAMMASPGWSLARSSSQVIILLLAWPPQAEKTIFIPPFMEHPTINLLVI